MPNQVCQISGDKFEDFLAEPLYIITIMDPRITE